MRFLNARSFILVSCVGCISLSASWADQLVLKNGDRVTGSIVKKDGKSITMKSDLFGLITAAWEQVESVSTDQPVTVVLQNNKTVQGTLATHEGKIEVSAQGTTSSLEPGEITALRNAEEQSAYDRLLHPGWRELWAGTASLGLAGTSGNARTLTFTTGVAAARVTNTDKTSLYFNAIKASARTTGAYTSTAKAVRGGLSYGHDLSPRLFLSAFNDYEHDRFQDLDLRFVIGGGAGFHAIKTELSRLDLLAGADYNHSRFSTPLTRSSAELFWGNEYIRKLSSATSIVQSFRMFNAVRDSGTRRINFDIGAVTTFSKWLTWNLSLSDRYLNRPAPGRKSNDFLYTTGVGITFSR